MIQRRTGLIAPFAMMMTSGLALPAVAQRSSAMPAPSPQEAKDIARDAYLYGYPLVLSVLTVRQLVNVERPRQPFAPMNQIGHARELPGPAFRAVVRPNVDTLYTSGVIDVGPEPMVFSLPAIDRYFMLPLMDLWTNIFAVPGSRTTGTAVAKEYLLVSPNWRGQVPAGLELIRSPTRYFSFLGRTQTNGVADYAAVHRIQDGMRLVPLSARGRASYRAPVGRVDPSIDMRTEAPVQVTRMSPATFFALLAESMKDNPPTLQDYPTLHRMARLGLHAGRGFNLASLSAPLREAVEAGVAEGRQAVQSEYNRLTGTGQRGWNYTREGGSYGVNYLLRAGVAAWGLGMNLPDDAIYPSTTADSEGKPFDGSQRYVWRFDRTNAPPIDAFWSITAYDQAGYFIPNEAQRQALGDRSNLVAGADGAVEIVIQAEKPDAAQQANWLPVKAGEPFNLMLRLYSPRPSVRDGSWTPPLVERRS